MKYSSSIYLASIVDSCSITNKTIGLKGQTSITIEANSFVRDGTITYYARQIDVAGNTSPCSSTSVSYTYDGTALAPSMLSLFSPSNNLGNDATPEIRVSGVEGNAQVELYSDSSCSISSSSQTSVPLGQTSITIEANSFVRDRTAIYYARQIDAAGNISPCSSESVFYTYDGTVLAPSMLSMFFPSNNLGNDATPEITVSGVEGNAQVELYSDNVCSISVSSQFSVSFGQTSVTIEANSLASYGTATYYARQIDPVGNVSECSASSVSYQYTNIPAISQITIESGSYFTTDVLNILVEFGENVYVDTAEGEGTPFLSLSIGSSIKQAAYQSGSSSNVLTFSYTIKKEDVDNDGISITSPININDGTIKSSSLEDAENAQLTFTPPENEHKIFVNFSEKIFTTSYAFAFVRSGGSVVTWGFSDYGNFGGDSSSVSSSLESGVSEIFSNRRAFAALKTDGSVVTWGYNDYGGDSSSVSSSLESGVSEIFSNGSAFAALKTDGSVVTWGNSDNGGDSSSVSSSLESGVSEIFSIRWGAFAALKTDGSVVTWGSSSSGGDSSSVSSSLESGVSEIFSNGSAFAALKTDGSVVTWGNSDNGGDSSSVSSSLSSGVSEIFSNGSAFAALKTDGSVVTWGNSDNGGDSSSVSSSLSSGVSEIFSNGSAFAALKTDGSVVTWGSSSYGGDSSSVSSSLSSGVSEIFSNGYAFAALKTDGSVVTWGNSDNGGDSSSVSSSLSSGVSEIFFKW